MKLSEISRYWAAKELTEIKRDGAAVTLNAPFASADFTIRLKATGQAPPRVTAGGKVQKLQETRSELKLTGGTYFRDGQTLTVCFELVRGRTTVAV
jgi:hypothetical protein